MTALRFSLLVLALAASVASVTSGDDGPPATDSCDEASVTGVESLTIVEANREGDTPLVDQQVMPLIVGPQGGAMLLMRFQLDGDSLPSCAKFSIALDQCLDLGCGQVVEDKSYQFESSLATYEMGPARVTRDYYLVLPYQFDEGTLLRLQVRVGLGTQERLLWIARIGDFPGSVADGGSPDAALDLSRGRTR